VIARAIRVAIATVLLAGCASQGATSSNPPEASVTPAPSATTSSSPAPTVQPSPTVQPTPVTSQQPEPTAGASSGARFNVDLVLSTGRTVTIEVKDDSGTLVQAASGTPGDGASVPDGTVAIVNSGTRALQLTWSGPPCATDNFLLIEEGAARMTVVQPMCSGDAIALDRVLLLTFANPISADAVDAVFQAGGDTPA